MDKKDADQPAHLLFTVKIVYYILHSKLKNSHLCTAEQASLSPIWFSGDYPLNLGVFLLSILDIFKSSWFPKPLGINL